MSASKIAPARSGLEQFVDIATALDIPGTFSIISASSNKGIAGNAIALTFAARMSSLPLFNATARSIALAASLLLSLTVPSADAERRDELVFATSANDPVLSGRLAGLSPTVDTDEARRVAYTAYKTGRDLRLEWRVVWPPGLQNFLVNTGAKKGGLCFQWAAGLLARLDTLKLQTLELHWAESFARTASEHNVIVVTAKGQPFQRGILLDNWRYSGRLLWGPIVGDPHYEWTENRGELARRLGKRVAAAER